MTIPNHHVFVMSHKTVNGKQKSKTKKSAQAKLTKKKFVTVLMDSFRITTNITKKFPTKPTISKMTNIGIEANSKGFG